MICKMLKVFGLALLSLQTPAATPTKPPKPLLVQIQRLGELLRDSSASWYRESTQVQFVKPRKEEEMALAVFTVEGFGGGNGHVQYLAAFSVEGSGSTQHFSLIDVLQVGGKGWRGIQQLNARLSPGPARGELRIKLDAMTVGPDDAPNFPSQTSTIELALKAGRLTELSPP